jgi:hypothetical protein
MRLPEKLFVCFAYLYGTIFLILLFTGMILKGE